MLPSNTDVYGRERITFRSAVQMRGTVYNALSIFILQYVHDDICSFIVLKS